MMLWFDRHRRLRDQLSVYIDGELDARAGERLERHLTRCQSCRLELEQLRATVSALREMPAVEPSRSFRLSPEQVAVPRPPLPAPSPLALGMRIAAAGVAAALAIVVVIDLGGFGGDGTVEEAGEIQMLSQRDMEASATEEGAAAPVAPETGADGESAFGSDTADEPAGTPAPEAEEPAATDKAETPEEAAAPAAAIEDEDGGIDALIVAEIALAVALVVLVAGGFGLAFAGRKR